MELRKTNVHFRANASEVAQIREKMEQLGIKSMAAYLRKMALDGYCVKLDLEELREMTRLLRICSNNLNQYAKKANEAGTVYAEDIRDLQSRMDEIWKTGKEVLKRLASIQ